MWCGGRLEEEQAQALLAAGQAAHMAQPSCAACTVPSCLRPATYPTRPPAHAPLARARLQAVLGCVLPLREENHMKAYLLHPRERGAMLQRLGGRLERVAGADALDSILQVWPPLGC